ncbi:unnamed protein product [Brassica napus]|uniref:(rape) hypothetical protein n=1 Tax=Brassica napus TaxID=3708 RepID=A0A816NH65_BRANA|nr:unnamed protein product [Brassica napus]
MVNHIKEKRTNNESRGDSRDLLIAKDSTNTHTNTLLCTNPLKPHCFHASVVSIYLAVKRVDPMSLEDALLICKSRSIKCY